jgi:TatD DNase family protein
MNFPQTGDYIDIHTHGGTPAPGIFIVESLMAHESATPKNVPGVAYTCGIHPWFLTQDNSEQLLDTVRKSVNSTEVIAIGEAGFDRLQGPSPEIQRRVFEEQVKLADEYKKPLIIHCVRAWEELLAVHKNLNPKTPWLIHGFRGTPELATQLFLKGLYLSLWFDFALRPESSKLLKTLPKSRFFLETDGADVDIRTIYKKVATDMDVEVEELKVIMLSNFNEFFHK